MGTQNYSILKNFYAETFSKSNKFIYITSS